METKAEDVLHLPARSLSSSSDAGVRMALEATSPALSFREADGAQRPRTPLPPPLNLDPGGDGFAWDDDVFYSRMHKELQEIVDSSALAMGDVGDQVNLVSPLPLVVEGVGDLVNDEFNRCFQLRHERPWNWNVYLFPAWLIGVLVRYCVLLPLRLLALVVGTIITIAGVSIVRASTADEQKSAARERRLISFYANVWIASWSGVVKYHGSRPRIRANQVYVANHTTMIDYTILLGVHPFAVVGQLHGGLLKVLQTKLLSSLDCIWFNRKDMKDRRLVRDRIKAHAARDDVPPLLIFPEGTCVNNDYCVMFKKGAFELDCEVHPVAIKYNKIFVDAFWDSRSQSFWAYLFKLMKSWALVCDVWFLPPETRGPDETAEDFAERVKQAICKRAPVTATSYDGYLKHMKASDRYVAARQKQIADELMRRMSFVRLESQSGKDVKESVLRQRKIILDVLKAAQ